MSVLESGQATHARPEGDGALVLSDVGPLIKISPAEMDRTVKLLSVFGIPIYGCPFCWCERDNNRIEVFPAPYKDFMVRFDPR